MDPRSELEIYLSEKYDRFRETHAPLKLYGSDFQRILNELKHNREKITELKQAGRTALAAMETARNVFYTGQPGHSFRAEGTTLNARIAEFRIELEKP